MANISESRSTALRPWPPSAARRWRLWLMLVLAATGATAAYAFISAQAAPTAPATSRTADAAAAREDRLVVPGKVEPVEGQLNLAFDVPGVLRRIRVAEGDEVEAGATLAELVNDELQARLEGARHEREQMAAKLSMLQNGARKEDRDEARAELGRAQAAVTYFEKLLPNRENLQHRQAIALDELLEFRLRAEEARKQRDVVAARLQRLEAGTRAEELAMAQAAQAAADAHVREVAAALDRTRLRAPRRGKVLRVLRREGESVMGVEAMPVILMADMRHLQIRAELDESQYTVVHPGLAVEIRPWGAQDRTIDGKLIRITDLMGRKQLLTDDPREKVDTRVLEVIIAPAVQDRLLINQRVDVMIRLDQRSMSGVLPH